MSTPDPTLHANPQKARKGFDRLWHATLYSLHGLKSGWDEPAFRMEACLAIVLVPLAFVVGQNWVETALLIAGVALLMIVELLNTAVEAAIDRIGPEWHDLSKRAKDMGSAAVFLTSLLTGGIWLAALWQRFLA
ncbi:diacylglycerol kinase [uncultured Pseudacidovorax sp.]|uniref:diacylglycerol kinase n=1 Tax=uncultured Pseudacidovorax sp. TaxID=679313 RepID=UPI0025DDAB15|nr:diacylglycerol kinase [uncultured Pseudacidovorax sp.]